MLNPSFQRGRKRGQRIPKEENLNVKLLSFRCDVAMLSGFFEENFKQGVYHYGVRIDCGSLPGSLKSEETLEDPRTEGKECSGWGWTLKEKNYETHQEKEK